jgi:hypothetical protein
MAKYNYLPPHIDEERDREFVEQTRMQEEELLREKQIDDVEQRYKRERNDYRRRESGVGNIDTGTL